MQDDNNLVWMDLEMTGLEPAEDKIIEIATIITDSHLKVLAEGPVLAIHQSQEVLEAMGKWCREQHGKSGLTQRVQQSQITVRQAEQQTLAFIKQYVPPNQSPLCGNSICQDRRFLARYMPNLSNYLHYRHLDVSTLKILAQRWAPSIMKGIEKEATHLALDDIRDSIEELRYYRQHLLKLEGVL